AWNPHDSRMDAARLGTRLSDRGVPHFLPGHGQHAARSPVRRSARARTDALLRRERLVDSVEAAGSVVAAVSVHCVQDFGNGERRGRHHPRGSLVAPPRPWPRDHQPPAALLPRTEESLGDEPDRCPARDYVLPRGRPRGEARRPPRAGASRMTENAVVSIAGLSKVFGKGAVTALDDINLD